MPMERLPLRILVLTKRQYMKKDLLDDRYGRMRELPLELAKRGHSVEGLCLSYKPRREETIRDGPVRWKSLNATLLKLPGLLRFMAAASRAARNVDCIWAGSDSFYGVMAYFLSRWHGIPAVFDLYDNFGCFLMAKLPVIKQLFRWALLHCPGVSCNGEALAAMIRSYGRTKPLLAIETTARLDLFSPIDQDNCRKALGLPLHAPIVGTAGALYRNRGIHLLLDAFKKLQVRHPKLLLALAGPREPGLGIESDPQIIDVGVLPHEKTALFINALDVAIIANADNAFGRYCFPQKAWEIMACKVPLIAAGVEGMRAFFKDYPEWMYDPNSSEDLANVLEKRLTDRRTGYRPAPSWSSLAEQLEELLYHLCPTKQPINIL